MAVAQEATGMPRKEPAYYTWSFPGAPVRIHLYLDVVESIQRQLNELGASESSGRIEFAGLLLGRGDLRNSPVVEVRRFISLISEKREGSMPSLTEADRLQFEKAIAAAESASDGRSSPVGYFRVRGGEGLCLNEDDLGLIHTQFRDPASVFLMIRPAADDTASAGFFFSDSGQVNADFTFLEFPFDAKALSGHAAKLSRRPQLVEPGQRAAPPALPLSQETPASPPPVSAPVASAARPPARPAATRSAFAAGLWFVAAAAVVAALMVALVSLGYWNFRLSTEPPIAAAPAVAGLSLQVERQGNELKITWEHSSDFIANARSGVLQVRDGDSRQQDLFLDAGQLRTGSVVYTPAGTSVQFRLEVLGADKTMSESVLALTAPHTDAQK